MKKYFFILAALSALGIAAPYISSVCDSHSVIVCRAPLSIPAFTNDALAHETAIRPVPRIDFPLATYAPNPTYISSTLPDGSLGAEPIQPDVYGPEFDPAGIQTDVPAVLADANDTLESPATEADSVRVLQAVYNDLRTNESPVIEWLDSDGCPVFTLSRPRHKDSITPGEGASVVLYAVDTLNAGNVVAFTHPVGTVQVTGACKDQNNRLARAAHREWLAIKYERANTLLAMRP